MCAQPMSCMVCTQSTSEPHLSKHTLLVACVVTKQQAISLSTHGIHLLPSLTSAPCCLAIHSYLSVGVEQPVQLHDPIWLKWYCQHSTPSTENLYITLSLMCDCVCAVQTQPVLVLQRVGCMVRCCLSSMCDSVCCPRTGKHVGKHL